MIAVSNSIILESLHRLPISELRHKQKITVYPKSLPPFPNKIQSNFSSQDSSFVKKEAENLSRQRRSTLTKWDSGLSVENDSEEKSLKVSHPKDYVDTIRTMFGSMDDGEVSASAYDTAWVALIEDVNGSGTPQFPSCLEWIANNQLPDGSWGDSGFFSAYDRILSTLACLIAFKTWNLHPDKCHKGISFLKDNLCKLKDENIANMTVAFEVVFPSLIEMARTRRLDIEVPDDLGVLQEIYSRRNEKFTRIPMDLMHKVPTTLLFNLEGMPDNLDWEKLLKLQCPDGSFFFSPSSTAFAFIQTKDENCLRYLTKTVERCKGAVPTQYPIDLFERIFAVDRLQRLGTSRYFELEIKKCLNYVYRYWTEDGICFCRDYPQIADIDDTCMGFRVLRLHGYQVSSDVFRPFEKGGEFFCYAGQGSESVCVMFNLYRASQLRFRREKILEDAEKFSTHYLREKVAANELLDKWVVFKDLPGEVGFAMEVPWYASLPRVETRFYIEQYGGENDVWIAKTLFRVPYIHSNVYLDFAKLDYNNCQALHCSEWDNFQKWCEEHNLRDFGISKTALLLAYFLAAANAFEPERSNERLAWAKTSVLLEAIGSIFDGDNNSSEQRRAFFYELKNGTEVNGRESDTKKTRQELLSWILLGTIKNFSLDAFDAHGRDVSDNLHQAWEKWLLKWEVEGDRHQGEAELLVQTMNLTTSYHDDLSAQDPQYEKLSNLTNRLCHQLGHYKKHKAQENGSYNTTSNRRITTPEIESGMQELVELVFQNSSGGILNCFVKQNFLAVAKSYYYMAFCDPQTINYHITKVLFERVE